MPLMYVPLLHGSTCHPGNEPPPIHCKLDPTKSPPPARLPHIKFCIEFGVVSTIPHNNDSSNSLTSFLSMEYSLLLYMTTNRSLV